MQVEIAGAVVVRVDLTDTGPHAERRLAARAIACGLVARLAGVPEAEVRIEARCPDCGGPHGRPVVVDPPGARNVHVSIAYAGRSVVAAVSARPIGVDAELRDQGPHTDARTRAIRTLAPGSGSGEDPLRHWTRIESVLKADGRGLRVDPQGVVFERQSASLVAGVSGDARRYDLHDIELGDDLVVSAALGR